MRGKDLFQHIGILLLLKCMIEMPFNYLSTFPNAFTNHMVIFQDE